MSSIPTMPGIISRMVATPRLRVHVLTIGPETGTPVVFVHGNASSAVFWEETMLALPAEFRAIAVDLRAFGDTEALPIDATRGMRDWSDDLKSLVDTMGLGTFHLVGWSLGAGPVLQYAIDHAHDVRSITLSAPMSPFGFGGTRDERGTPTYPDFAGSGGGAANPDFVQRMANRDTSSESPNSPRNVMNAFYWKAPFRPTPEREEVFLQSLLSERVGAEFYPGEVQASANWPMIAPGTTGVLNAASPKYCRLDGFASIAHKPPVLWIHGDSDMIIGDTSMFDFGVLGKLGFVPGWPGEEVCPPQPMVSQMRYLLECYSANGGTYHEIVLEDCGHSPHIEKPGHFIDLLLPHLRLN